MKEYDDSFWTYCKLFLRQPFAWIAIIFAILAIALPTKADTIFLNPTGPYFQVVPGQGCIGDLGVNVSGPCGLANIYQFTPLISSGTSCLYVFNSGGVTAVIPLSVAAFPNPGNLAQTQRVNYTTNSTLTAAISPVSGLVVVGGANGGGIQPWQNPGIKAGTWGVATLSISGGPIVQVNFGSSSGATTAQFFIAQYPGNSPCSAVGNALPISTGLISGNASPYSAASIVDPAYECLSRAILNNPPLGTNVVLSVGASFPASTVRICSLTFSTTPASSFKLVEGHGTNCGTGTLDITGTQPTTTTFYQYIGLNVAPLVTQVGGNDVCATLGTASTTGTVEIHYAIF